MHGLVLILFVVLLLFDTKISTIFINFGPKIFHNSLVTSFDPASFFSTFLSLFKSVTYGSLSHLMKKRKKKHRKE